MNEFPRFQGAYRAMANPSPSATGRKEVKPWTDAMRELDHLDSSDDANLVRVGFWYNQVFLTGGINSGAEELSTFLPNSYPELLKKHSQNPVLSTRIHYTFYLPKALAFLRSQDELSVQSGLRESALILLGSGCFPDLTDKWRGKKILHRSQIRARKPLIDPHELAIRLRLDTPPPTLEILLNLPSLQDAARRVISIILLHGWQRFRALRLVELVHLIASPNFVEIIIPDNKGGWRMSRLPMDRLAPSNEIQYLRNFITTANAREVDPSTRLTEIAGFGTIERSGVNARKFYRIALRHYGRMHDGRHCGLSIAPLRAMVARNQKLLNHPYFPQNLRTHPWFSEEGLKAFLELVPAAQTDSVEVFRRIAGWTTYAQFSTSYCRSWHLILALGMPIA